MNPSKPSHPSRQELVELTIDELSLERAEEIREHVLDCPECSEITRNLLGLPENPPAAEPEVDAAEHARAWAALKAIVQADAKEAKAEGMPALRLIRGGAGAGDQPPKRWTVPLAALVAAGVGLVLGRWVWPGLAPGEMQSVAITNLKSSAFYQRGAPEERDHALCPAESGDFVWVMAPSFVPGATPKTVEVEVSKANGGQIGRQNTTVSPRGEVQVSLPRTLVENGTYLIRVRWNTDQAKTEEFTVSVDCQ